MVPITSFTLTAENFVIMEIGICFQINALTVTVKVFPDGLFPLQGLPKASVVFFFRDISGGCLQATVSAAKEQLLISF